MIVKKIIIGALTTLFSIAGFSQNNELSQRDIRKDANRERVKKLIKQEEEGALIFQKQIIYGIKLNTDGYGAFLELGKQKTTTKTNSYILEIGERKHPKEEKLTRGVLGFAIGNPFIFGKINNFYYTKLGFQQERLIGGKGNRNGIAVSAIYGGGLSVGLLKPYYIRIIDPMNGKQKEIKYNNNDSLFLSADIINGAAGFGKGFKELKIRPGLFAKTALRFDYGKYNELVSALEVGLNVEFYSSKMPIVLRNSDRQLFFNAYVAVVFGKRK